MGMCRSSHRLVNRICIVDVGRLPKGGRKRGRRTMFWKLAWRLRMALLTLRVILVTVGVRLRFY